MFNKGKLLLRLVITTRTVRSLSRLRRYTMLNIHIAIGRIGN